MLTRICSWLFTAAHFFKSHKSEVTKVTINNRKIKQHRQQNRDNDYGLVTHRTPCSKKNPINTHNSNVDECWEDNSEQMMSTTKSTPCIFHIYMENQKQKFISAVRNQDGGDRRGRAYWLEGAWGWFRGGWVCSWSSQWLHKCVQFVKIHQDVSLGHVYVSEHTWHFDKKVKRYFGINDMMYTCV